MTTQEFVTISRFLDPVEAQIVAGRLEASGIPVHLLGIHHVSANSMLAVALGGVRLQVPATRLEEARRLLSEDVGLERDSVICPQCGHADSVRRPLAGASERQRCNNCGHVWSEDAQH
jgi:hypothetical protein